MNEDVGKGRELYTILCPIISKQTNSYGNINKTQKALGYLSHFARGAHGNSKPYCITLWTYRRGLAGLSWD